MAAGAYRPRPAPLFMPERIILAKGSVSTPERRRLAEGICAAYPEAEVVEAAETPHNRVDLGEAGMLARHERGKQALVLAEHQSAVRFSQEQGNACPNYWHFSPYGFCPYGCHYCYLAGTPGVRFSPTVKIFLNLEEILGEVDQIARGQVGNLPNAFYLGKLQDGLALDPLTGYSRAIVPFFARHPIARLTLLTKSADVTNLLDLEHAGRSILSWSLNPPEIVRQFEENTPEVEDRIAAMQACGRAGYPLRAVLMPIIPVPGWREVYCGFLAALLARVTLQRITLGSICSYPHAMRLTEQKLGRENAISELIRVGQVANLPRCDVNGGKRNGKLATCPTGDGRIRFPSPLREEVYRALIETIRDAAPGLEIGLCLEDPVMFKALGLQGGEGRCNCVL